MRTSLEIDRNNLTIMGIKFSNLKALENTANVIGSNMFEGFEPTPKRVEIVRDYVLGKITLAQLIQITKDKLYV